MTAAPNIRRLEEAGAKVDAALKQSPAVRLLRGSAVALKAVLWLWFGFLPAGMLSLLGGAPGTGKSTLALWLAAIITRGGTWPDGTRCREPGDVIVWSGEDPPSVTAARLVAAGADMSRVYFIDGLTGCDGEHFDPARDIDLLESTARKLPAPRLLILDPIVSSVAGDGHKNSEVRRSLQPVVDLAARLGCAVLGITHFSKGTAGRDPTERITGSLAFAALARVVVVAAKTRPGEQEQEGGESRRVFLRAKSNVGPDDGGFAYELERVEVASGVEGQRVRWLEAIEGTARDVLADAESDPSDEADDAADVDGFLRGLLAAGPVNAKAVKADADGAGYAWRTVQRAAQRIGAERRKEGMKGGWMWSLRDAPKAPLCPEGAEDASQKSLAPSAPSGEQVAPSGKGAKDAQTKNLGPVGTLEVLEPRHQSRPESSKPTAEIEDIDFRPLSPATDLEEF